MRSTVTLEEPFAIAGFVDSAAHDPVVLDLVSGRKHPPGSDSLGNLLFSREKNRSTGRLYVEPTDALLHWRKRLAANADGAAVAVLACCLI